MDSANSITACRLTTIRRSRTAPFAEGALGVRVVGWPTVGRPLVMYGGDGNRRIVTSPVIRMFTGTQTHGTFIQTRNSLYLLER
jgi:hypothetical protein